MPKETYFAPAQKADKEMLDSEINLVSNNPITDCLMHTISGLFAVLNEQRQIVALNKTMLEQIGVDDDTLALGLRPGEALNCIHAHEEPHGCGTTKYCSSCGAAIAIVASLKNDSPEERTCAATITQNGQELDICFKVRSVPVTIENHRFLLLFMQDITNQQAWATLERTFFHDLNNILTGVIGTTELLGLNEQTRGCSEKLSPMLRRLQNEIDLHKTLSSSKETSYEPSLQNISLLTVEEELKNQFSNHPAATGKSLDITPAVKDQEIYSDYSLLMRILTNMLTNAFEASELGNSVKFWIEQDKNHTTFHVWNSRFIPANIQLRIFQRHFSTKIGEGRGIGTFSMKLFGEKFLKGKVNFTSSEQEGTLFRLTLAT